MKDCKLTVLKKQGTDGNLPKIGEMTFEVSILDGESSFNLSILSRAACDCYFENATPSSVSLTANVEQTVQLTPTDANKNVVVKIMDKYHLAKIAISGGRIKNINVDDLAFSKEMLTLDISGPGGVEVATGNLSSLTGNLLLNLKIANLINIVGDIASLAVASGLINFTNTSVTGIYGAVEDVVAGMVNNNRVSGTLTLSMKYTTGITFNNTNSVLRTKNLIITFGSLGAAVKDADNNLLGTYTKAGNTWAYPGTGVIN